MKCPSCRTRELVVIQMTVNAEPVTLRSCSRCDRHWWEKLDGTLTVDSMLELVGRRPPPAPKARPRP